MKRALGTTIALLMFTLSLNAQTAPDAPELTKLLNEFLLGAGRNDAATHERFWADELIYTGAAGRRVGKTDIMNDVRSSPTPVGGQRTSYTAEDVRIRQYGNTAIVAFRLVAKVEKGNETETTRYLNTGTFLKRKGKWQAVSWQATRMPRAEADAKKEIAAVDSAFHQATLSSDVNTLESILDESFVWTHSAGQQQTRQALLENLRTGELKYSKMEMNNMIISVSGDTGIVRGVTVLQRSAIPGSTGTGDAAPFTASYTLTLVNKGGPWKAVAMHTSRK